MLPDIDQDSYDEYEKQRVQREIARRQQTFGVQAMIGEKIADIGTWGGQAAEAVGETVGGAANAVGTAVQERVAPAPPPPEPEPPPPSPEPQPAPPPRPAPPPPEPEPSGDWRSQSFRQALQAVQQSGGDIEAFSQEFGRRAGSAGDDAKALWGAALGAAGKAGADLDTFASSYRPPEPPARRAPEPASDYRMQVPAAARASTASPDVVGRGGDLRAYARQAAERAGVDPDIFTRQIQQESGFSTSAKSGAGAQGIAQIMPQYHPGVDPSDPYASLDYAAKLMASNVKKYGGDYSKALAAYNAGAGAVDKYGGVPPFEETQTYIKNILGGAKEAVGGVVSAVGQKVRDISQFGDPQLTTDEAYAACGPAAAVRFAQRFGRNPSLREATDMAKEVGWTQQQGMAGLGSQQRLMSKLGVETSLVPGAQWDKFAAEAQTGNPVTISTSAHYFYADGFNPQTGQFHVGRSGLDLKGGAEWMTRAEIEAAAQRLGGGNVQGALFANNPTVAAPSTAETGPPQLGNPLQGAADLVQSGQQRLERDFAGIDATRQRIWEGAQGIPDRIRSFIESPEEATQGTSYGNLGPNTVQRMNPTSPETGNPVLDFAGTLASGLGTGVQDTAKVTGALLNEISPGTHIGRFYEGYAGELRRDPEYREALNALAEATSAAAANPTPSNHARIRALESVMDARAQEVRGATALDPGAAYARGMASPEREGAELVGNLVTSAAAMGIAPQGLASGGRQFAASLALDPSGAPLQAAGELLGPAARGLGKLAGRDVAPTANIVENLPNYPAGTPEYGAEQVFRASRDAPGGDGLAHVDLNTLPDVPFSQVGGKGVIKTNSGGLPSLDDLRALRDANLHNRDFYADQADDATELVGDNLGEWFSLNSINSPLTKIERQIEESINAMGVVREAAREAEAQGKDVAEAVRRAVSDKDRLSLAGVTAGNKRKDIAESYLTGISEVAGAPKTSSFAGNYDSAGRRVFDPRVTNDIWNWRIMNVSDETKVGSKGQIERIWEKNAANNDAAYRIAEAAFNEVATEKGLQGLQGQSAMWSGIRAMAAKNPEAYKLWKAGQFQDAVRMSEAAGDFKLADAGEIAVAMQAPGVQRALARYGHVLKDPPPLMGKGMSREYMGFAPSKPASRLPRPSSREFRESERAVAESRGPLVAGLDEPAVRALGLAEDGSVPWLTVPNRVEQLAPGQYAIHLPGGNSMTQRYVASVIGDALGVPEVVIHTANYRAPDMGGLSVVNTPEVIDALRISLDEAGIPFLRGTTGRSVQIPLESVDEGRLADIIQVAQRAGLAPSDLAPYAGATQRVVSREYAANLAELGPTFGPTTPGRSGLRDRAVRDLRQLGQERAAASERPVSEWGSSVTRGGADELPGAGLPGANLLRGATAPLRTELGRGALQGGVAGGISAAQEPGATPQDVALGALGGSVLGAGRSLAGRGVGARAIPRIAQAVEGTGDLLRGERPAGESARLLDQHGNLIPKGDIFDQAAAQKIELPPGFEKTPELQSIHGPTGELLQTLARQGQRAAGAVTWRGAEMVGEPSAEVAKRMPNMANMATDMPDVAATIMANANLDPVMIERYKRGTIHHDDLVNTLAERFGMTKEQYLKTPAGKAFNEAELLALRATMADEDRRIVQATRMVEERGGVKYLNPEEKLGMIGLILDGARLQAVATGAASTAGRTLNQMKIKMSQEMSRSIVSGIEKRQATKAAREATSRQAAAQKRIAELEKRAADRAEAATQRAATREQAAAERATAKQEAAELKKVQDAERKATRELEIADRRLAKEEERFERVHSWELDRARRAMEVLGPENISDSILEEFVTAVSSKDSLAVGKFIKGIQKVNWWDRVNIIRYAGMLSATATHGVQAASNLLQVGLIPATHAVAVPFDIMAQGFGRGERTRYWGELGAMMSGAKGGFSEGFTEAQEVMRSGINTRSLAQDLEHMKGGKMRQPSFGMGQTILGKVIGKRASAGVDFVAEAPLRAMMASDLMFRGAARGMHTRGLAMRKALNEGYKGDDAVKRMMDISQNLDEHMELVDEADKLARRAVLQEESAFPRALRAGPTALSGALSWLVPFVRTPYNIAAQGLGMTPAGFLSARQAAARGERGEAVDRVARASLGTGIMIGAGFLAAEGHLTGGFPADDRERSTLPPGWRPWSLRVVKPDGEQVYVPFSTLGPVGVPLAVGAAGGEAAAKGDDVVEWMPKAAASIGKYMVDQSMLAGFNNVMNTIIDPERYAERFVESFVSQPVPYSGLQRQLLGLMGVGPRDPEGPLHEVALEALRASNIFTAPGVEPRLNPLGEEVSTGQTGIGALMPFRYGTGRDTPLLEAMRTAEVNIPKPSTVRQGVPFTPEEQRLHQQLSGQYIKEYTARAMAADSYQKGDNARRKLILDAAVEAARDKAAGDIFRDMRTTGGANEIRRRYLEEQARKAPVTSVR